MYIVSTRVLRLADLLGEDNLQASPNQQKLLKKMKEDNAKL